MPCSWVAKTADEIADRAIGDLRALVAVSSPSGDRDGAETAVQAAIGLLPEQARVQRPACSSPDHAADLLATLKGTGGHRLLLLGHLDTVVAHPDHRPLSVAGDQLDGSGTIDMKGGVALALGLFRALSQQPETFCEVALLLVVDEEWRTSSFVHGSRFAAFDACLCFEAGELTADGGEAVIVRRKAAAAIVVQAHGRASHSGAAPDEGANALLALAAVAQAIATHHDPGGPDRLTAVPTILHSGRAINVVPARGELTCDLRADRLEAFAPVLAALPDEIAGVTLKSTVAREWPGMDSMRATEALLCEAGTRLGRPIHGAQRGGASDASHLAAAGVGLTIDGLGPRGAGAHTPDEHVIARSLRERAEVAAAVTAATLHLG